MATGFCPSVLLHINEVAEGNAPGRKLHIAGFLASLFCCQNSTVNPVNTEQFNGFNAFTTFIYYTGKYLVYLSITNPF